MKKSNKIFQISIFIIFISAFTIFYFLYLIRLYNSPKNYAISIILIIGFIIIISSIFITFYLLTTECVNKALRVNFYFLNEDLIKLILIILMIIFYFVPSITFSDSIIDWNNIGLINYFRAVIFLLGAAFIPGANIYNILFSKLNLPEKFKIESFFLKLTLYPLLAFSFLSVITLIFDFIGLERIYFPAILLISIIILYILEIFIRKFRNGDRLKFKITKIEVSKFSLIILYTAIGIIFVAFSIHLSFGYLIPGDSWRGINYASVIGNPDLSIYERFCGAAYTKFWGYTSFALSALSGIPYINVNCLLFPFVYLFITSIYLFNKVLLHNLKEKYALLSTLLVIIFSELFYFLINDSPYENLSWLIFDGILIFRYKSFSFDLLIMAITFFIILPKIDTKFDNDSHKEAKNNKLLICITSAFFLIQSVMIYFLPIIPGFSFLFLYSLISGNLKQSFKFFILFILYFFLFFLLFDLLSYFFISWTAFYYFHFFAGDRLLFDTNLLLIRSFIIYSVIISLILLTLLFYKILRINVSNRMKKYCKLNIKVIFLMFLILFSILIGIEVFFNLILSFQQNFFLFYINAIFLNIGFIGILGIYFSYFWYKKKRNLFYLLIIWALCLIGIASIIIFYNWIKYPSTLVSELPSNNYNTMMHWFDRIWQYSIIPLSILASIGIIKFKRIINFKKKFKVKKQIILSSYLIFCSTFIIFSFSNTIIAANFWHNYKWDVNNEEAQVMGWVSNNIPLNHRILIESGRFVPLNDLVFCKKYGYLTTDEFKEALSEYSMIYFPDNYSGWIVNYHYDLNCTIEAIDNLQKNNLSLKFSDLNNTGSASLKVSFNSYQYNGFIEFQINASDIMNGFEFNFLSNENETAILFYIDSGAFFCYNGTEYQKIINIENEKLYHCIIYFESSEENFIGLNQYSWKIEINGSQYGNYYYRNNVSQIQSIELITSKLNDNVNLIIDGIKFSWNSDSYVEKYIYTIPVLINDLKFKKIFYFLITDGNEKYYSNLFSTIFKKKIYSYGIYTIYQSIFI